VLSVNAQTTAKSNIHYINDTTLNFSRLINQFKNKIIYVDVWAPWCTPCRQELQDKKAMQRFAAYAAKNDIVILYIAGDKDRSKWMSYIINNNLVGYHFLMNKAVYVDFHTTYAEVQKRGRGGVLKRSLYLPRHLIIGKNGIVADSLADRQGSPKVYAVLNKLLQNKD
jgi:thiol-disulfide isomerase/thioredoxin